MDDETASHLGQVLRSFVEYWQLIVFLLGIVSALLLATLHKVFATKAHVGKCKEELSSDIEHKLDNIQRHNADYHLSNSHEHNEIKDDIRVILGHLLHFERATRKKDED